MAQIGQTRLRLWQAFGSLLPLLLLTGIGGAQTPAPGPGRVRSAHMIADINATPLGSPAEIDLTPVGDKVYFSAWTSTTGTELWSSDGTAAGTGLVADLFEGPGSASPTALTRVGDTLYFAADSGQRRHDLWRLRSDTPPERVFDGFAPGSLPPDTIVSAGGLIFFAADDGVHGRELWRSDGTRAGTRLVVDLAPGAASADPTELIALEGQVFFRPSIDGDIWRSDGTAEGTIGGSGDRRHWYGSRLTAHDGKIFFLVGSDVYVGSGDGGWVRITPKTWGYDECSFAPNLLAAGQTAVFAAINWCASRGEDGMNTLWRTDGTFSGTYTSAAGLFDPVAELVTVGSRAYVRTIGGSLYTSLGHFHDATRIPGRADRLLGERGGRLLYLEQTGDDTVLLRSTDASAGEGALIATLASSSSVSLAGIGQPATLAGKLLWVQAGELWSTDGTPAGTAMVARLPSATGSSYPMELTAVGDNLFFSADDGVHGRELWRSDGTAQGTFLVADICPGGCDSYPTDLFATPGGELLLVADDGVHGRELWRSDGTAQGTAMVVELLPGDDGTGSEPGGLVAVGATVFFIFEHYAQSSVEHDLWATDGTAAGTRKVADFLRANQRYVPEPALTPLGASVLFFASGSSGGGPVSGLWRSDGTAAGTMLLQAFAVLDPPKLLVVGEQAYMINKGEPADKAIEIWATDGSPTGTGLVHRLEDPQHRELIEAVVAEHRLFFTDGETLYMSDGTAAGTTALRRLAGFQYPKIENLTALHDGMLADTSAGTWRSDGTALGTVDAPILLRGPRTRVRGTFVMPRVEELFNSRWSESLTLWMSDGTSAGTRPLQRFPASKGSRSIMPDNPQFVAAGDRLYFEWKDTNGGAELGVLAGAELFPYLHYLPVTRR